MAKAEVRYYSVVAKGKRYNYAWRGGPRLLETPNTSAFFRELQDRLAERKVGDRRKISGLCAMFRASDEWKAYTDKTRKNWGLWLDRIQDHFGDLSIATFDRPAIKGAIRIWRDKFKATPRSADMGLQVLSRLLTYGSGMGLLSTNATKDIGHLYKANRADIIWTADDITELEKHASKELMWAVRLAMFTGLRQGDLLRLSWSHVKDHSIEIRTGKSKGARTAVIPLHADLRALLKAIPKRATTVLTTTEKRPWKSGFGASWGAAVRRAEIDKHFHDLRGTAATRLYLADMTIREIAEIMAWSENQVERLIDRYVKRDELLKDRIRRLDANASGTNSEKLSAKPSEIQAVQKAEKPL